MPDKHYTRPATPKPGPKNATTAAPAPAFANVVDLEPRISPTMAIEWWHISDPIPYEKNARKWSEVAIAKVASSIREYGWRQPIVVDKDHVIVIGHLRLAAAFSLGLTIVPVHVAADLNEAQIKGLRIADNRTHEEATWDDALLAAELDQLKGSGFDLALTGFDDAAVQKLLATASAEATTASNDTAGDTTAQVDRAAELLEKWQVVRGEVWSMGVHRLMCGDSTSADDVATLMDGKNANVAFTSPPYASQRKYDGESEFKPIAPEQYVAWFSAIAARIRSVLAGDGSYFLNIKEHANDGQRHLYVKDLTIAHVREWSWHFVDEFCWRKTDNGVPGSWPNRFKNAWELVFHFATQNKIKFHPETAGHESKDCFDYSAERRWFVGAEGTGQTTRNRENAKKIAGIALPSNVIEATSEGGQANHSAPFPVALPAFFIKAFTDKWDIVFDPFLGSGTTMVASLENDRACYGMEISPKYCAVILERMKAAGMSPVRI